jgi:hypothetical protein
MFAGLCRPPIGTNAKRIVPLEFEKTSNFPKDSAELLVIHRNPIAEAQEQSAIRDHGIS